MIDIRQFNIALLGKWIRHLGHEKQSLWKEVVDSKYGGWRDLRSQRNSCCDPLWWRDLKEVWSMTDGKTSLRITFLGRLKVGGRSGYGRIDGWTT